MDERDARDLIVRAIAALYLNAQSAAARADAAQSRVTDSSALYKLAKDKHDAGTATGVDVLRAQVQLANDRQALLIAAESIQAIAARTGAQSGHGSRDAAGAGRAARLSSLAAAGD
jgi:outer membrane protein TolC